MLVKKRKLNEKRWIFNEKWFATNFVVQQNEKAMCLIFNEVLTAV